MICIQTRWDAFVGRFRGTLANRFTGSSFEKGLDIPPQFQSAVDTFCDRVLKSSCAASGKNAPPPLLGLLGSAGKAEISSVCSCLVSHCHTSTSKPTATTGPATSTCAPMTLTVSVTPTFCTATSRPPITVSTATVTVTATNTVSETAPTVTDTVVATATDIVSETASTITDTVTAIATETFSLPGTTVTISTTATHTVSLPGTTVTVPATTVTVSPSAGAVDQNGCPAIQGSSALGFVIYCDSYAGAGSFAYGSNPGYNIEDCSAQCYYDIIGGDCLAVSYTPPAAGAYSSDGQLNPGVCLFFEFVSAAIQSDQGVVLGVFQNVFDRKVRKA